MLQTEEKSSLGKYWNDFLKFHLKKEDEMWFIWNEVATYKIFI